MQKEELERLIDGKPDDIKAKGILLFNAYLKTQLSVKDDPSSQNYRNMNSAQEALEEFRIAQSGEKSDEKYTTEKSVLKYLEDNGWKISKPTLNRHIKTERKLLRQNDGTFTQNPSINTLKPGSKRPRPANVCRKEPTNYSVRNLNRN